MAHLVLNYLHLMGAIVLIGTGAGIAFFMVMTHSTGHVSRIAGVARIVVIADFVFTASAVIAQPVTAVLLAMEAGYDLTEGWTVLSVILYIVMSIFCLPAVVM
jgi:uncharacterized membrane protein